jgi:hypothetical protein
MGVLRTREVQITKNLSEVEKNFGVDLKLTRNGDLEVSNLKDLKLIAGGENAAQALRIKLGIEPGSLLYHSDLGTDLQIGSKTRDAFTLKLQITKTILKDARFENVDVKVQVIDSFIIADIKVTLKSTGIAVPLRVAVER